VCRYLSIVEVSQGMVNDSNFFIVTQARLNVRGHNKLAPHGSVVDFGLKRREVKLSGL